MNSAYKRMFDYASVIIAVSKHMAEQLVSLGAPAEKIVYNPYGVEIDKFAQAAVLHFSASCPFGRAVCGKKGALSDDTCVQKSFGSVTRSEARHGRSGSFA